MNRPLDVALRLQSAGTAMARRSFTLMLGVLFVATATSIGNAQPELERYMRERGRPVVPAVPRFPRARIGPRPMIEAPFAEPRRTIEAPFAGPARRRQGFLSPQDVLAILEARNLSLIGELRRRGDYYILDAQERHGGAVRLVINGSSGTVEGMRMRVAP